MPDNHEKAILAGLELKRPRKHGEASTAESSLEELRRLCETAGGEPLGIYAFRVQNYNPATLIGTGQAEELAHSVKSSGASTVIFDEELSPAQQRNLENIIHAKIIDRTRLILDIFAQRARTREGELQVELAQLSYLLPRLTGRGSAMMQQTGGIGTRGPGERKIEYDRRRLRDHIVQLEREIEVVRRDRDIRRQRRASVPLAQIAIAGYTNAGKSTLLNTLSGKRNDVYADDKLFATLDPTTRRIRLKNGGHALFTDTVGFIQKLPHSLVAAFRATMEEITLADCILHVRDASSPFFKEQKETVLSTLAELRAGAVPVIEVLNKSDLLEDARRAALLRENPQALIVSALNGDGLDICMERIETVLSAIWKPRKLLITPERGAMANMVHESCMVTGRTENADGSVELSVMATDSNWQRINAKLSGTDNT
jgi:GTP-binding protein HflX